MTYGNHGWSGGIYLIDEKVIMLQISNLVKKNKGLQIQITDVAFFSNYNTKSSEENQKMNRELYGLHQF